MENTGIDYGKGVTNIDTDTGIRYGVISQNEVLERWVDSAEHIYDPYCPHCGNELPKDETEYETENSENWREEYTCPDCKKRFASEERYGEEPSTIIYDSDGYKCTQDSYGDIFILKSPYYTYAQFCSPCAPGACYLENPISGENKGNKCYCFNHEWFDSGKAPYTVYNVETGEIVSHTEEL